MTYGISSSPEIFQRVMDNIPVELMNTKFYLINRIKCGSTLQEQQKQLQN